MLFAKIGLSLIAIYCIGATIYCGFHAKEWIRVVVLGEED